MIMYGQARSVTIHKSETGFGFNVRGQVGDFREWKEIGMFALTLCLSVCLFVCPSLYPSRSVSARLCLSAYVSVCTCV